MAVSVMCGRAQRSLKGGKTGSPAKWLLSWHAPIRRDLGGDATEDELLLHVGPARATRCCYPGSDGMPQGEKGARSLGATLDKSPRRAVTCGSDAQKRDLRHCLAGIYLMSVCLSI